MTRTIETDTFVLGVASSETEAAHLVDDDIEQNLPKCLVVKYHVQSHSVA